MPFFTSGDLKNHYKIEGKGPRLVFILGTESDLRQDIEIFKSPLCHHFELLSFDPRGIGQSTSQDEKRNMFTYANDLNLLIDAIG
ncbi:MAG: alpha/beta hydrolase [Parachlamydiales bacterium]|nr:alpha/beta hydrolase [Parachlamydiales bacterium]